MSVSSDAIAETSGSKTETTTDDKGAKSISEILDKFAEDDKEPEAEKVDLLAEEDETKTAEDKEPEEKEDKPAEEADAELLTPVRLKAIEKKYPEIFKDFPWLKVAYQRDHQYVEIFPTVDDAKEAAEGAEQYVKFSNDLFSGKIDSVFKSLKQAEPDGFARVVDNLLPALHAADEKAYYHVIGNTTKNLIASMVREAKDSENEDLGKAAVILHQFMFGKSSFEEPKNYGKPADETKTVDKERQQFLQERFEVVGNELDRATTNAIKSTIDIQIDPNGKMSPYVKKQAVREAMEHVEEAIQNDPSTSRTLARLWSEAAKKNFNKSSLEDVKRAYLSKAKTVLRDAINKARTEALKGSSSKAADKETEDDGKSDLLGMRKETRSSGRPASNKGKPAGMSTRQFLDMD